MFHRFWLPSFRLSRVPTASLLTLVALSSTAGAATISAGDRCEAGKLKLVATYASCRLKEDASALTKSVSPDYSRCVDVFTGKFPKLEEAAGPMVCPSEGDVADIQARSDAYTGQVATLLAGGSIEVTTCGDGALDAGEDCEAGNLAGQTCVSQGFDSGDLACAPGCTFDTSGCHSTRFEDNGSTVIDHLTGLEWEKKDGANGVANNADVHDVDNAYTWAQATSPGTQVGPPADTTQFLSNLNGFVIHGATNTDTATNVDSCFEKHCDWRLPNVDELKSITVLQCGTAPCIPDPAFIPTRSGRYWTDSVRASNPAGAYRVEFTNGTIAGDAKTTAYFARAVRSF